MKGRLLPTFLHYKVKVVFIYRVLQSPLFTHVMCNELVNEVLEWGCEVRDLCPLANTPWPHLLWEGPIYMLDLIFH
jgi:hypothetical protein